MAGLYVVDRFRRCYLLRWGRFHHRGMLAFAGIWGGEVADAKHEGRDPNKARALSMLMRVIDPQAEASQHLVDFADLTIRKGGYFADLLTANPTVLPSQGSAFPLDSVVEHARKLDLSPEMIIARSVERALGEQEAARYAAALLTGKAK